ncbi:hypothetical protein [Gordonia oryzae]|uniref:hypothetical protein n=1 Tax=Gordonia oryzae TaxID=2487349 RepID=UPI00319E47BC
MPDPHLDDVTDDIHLDVLGDSVMAIPAHIGALTSDPKTVAMVGKGLSGGKARHLISDTYDDLAPLPSARSSDRSLCRPLLGGHRAPALFRCTTGKGWTGGSAASSCLDGRGERRCPP